MVVFKYNNSDENKFFALNETFREAFALNETFQPRAKINRR